MNWFYKSIWSAILGTYVAAAETTSASGRKFSSTRKVRRQPDRAHSGPLALEQRIVFDAALVVTFVDIAADSSAEQADVVTDVDPLSASSSDASAELGETTEVTSVTAVPSASNEVEDAAVTAEGEAVENGETEAGAQALVTQADTSSDANEVLEAEASTGRVEILFVDASVGDLADELEGFPGEIYVLDASLDGVEQIAAILSSRTGVDAIHIMSHGSAGQLTLGTGSLDTASMSAGYADELAIIAAALSTGGDILLYGCDVAAGNEGEAFVAALADATHADVAASVDDTGAKDLGGDWVLEHQVGVIESASLSAQRWRGLLAVTTGLEAAVVTMGTNYSSSAATSTGVAVSTTFYENSAKGADNSNKIDNSAFTFGTVGVNAVEGMDMNFSGTELTGLNAEMAFTFTGSDVYEVYLHVNSVDQVQLEFLTASNPGISWAVLSSVNLSSVGSGSNMLLRDNNPATIDASASAETNDVGNSADFTVRFYSTNGTTPIDTLTLSWQYNPNADKAISGRTVTVDGLQIAMEVLTKIDYKPVAVNDTVTTQEDTQLTGDLSDNDTESADGGNIWSVATEPTHGTVTVNGDGTYTYMPNADYNGMDSFTYTITDADGDTSTATVAITVNPVNDVPVAEGDTATTDEDTAVTGDLSGNDTASGDGGNIWSVATEPAHGTVTVNADGSYTYAPNANYNGPDSFTYTITDADGDTSTATVAIAVNPVNDVPVAVDDAIATNEDTPFTGKLGDNDAASGDGGNLWTVTTVPTHGMVTVNGDGTYTYTAHRFYIGADSFTYTITDADGDTSTAMVSIAVERNESPRLNVPRSGDPGGPRADPSDPTNLLVRAVDNALLVIELNRYFADPNSVDTLTITPDLTGLPTWVTYNPSTAILGGTPPADNTGVSVVVPVTVDDGHGGSFTGSITITPENPRPVAQDGAQSGRFNTPVVLNLIGNDSDPDGDAFTITAVSVPASQGTVAFNGAHWIFTPVAGFSGAATISYTITDADGATDSAVQVVNVAPRVVEVGRGPRTGTGTAMEGTPRPPSGPRPVDVTRPGEPPAVSTTPTVALPVATVPALHVLYAVGESASLSIPAGSVLPLNWAPSPLVAEAAGRTPDNLLLNQTDPYQDLRLNREPALGEVVQVRHALPVQYAVRYQAVTPEPGLFVQHVVRSSQLDAQLVDAAVSSHHSAAIGYGTLLDPFALGAPGAGAQGVQLLSEKEADRSEERIEKTAPSQARQGPIAAQFEASEILRDKRPAVGFKAQLAHFSKDHRQGARPVTRITSVSVGL